MATLAWLCKFLRFVGLANLISVITFGSVVHSRLETNYHKIYARELWMLQITSKFI